MNIRVGVGKWPHRVPVKAATHRTLTDLPVAQLLTEHFSDVFRPSLPRSRQTDLPATTSHNRASTDTSVRYCIGSIKLFANNRLNACYHASCLVCVVGYENTNESHVTDLNHKTVRPQPVECLLSSFLPCVPFCERCVGFGRR